MTVRLVEIHVCDRCGAEFIQCEVKSTKLKWMFLTYGGGSASSHDKHFCDSCTESFKTWLAAEK